MVDIRTDRDLFGTWTGVGDNLLIQLRVDAGTAHSLDVLSADVFERQGAAFRFSHSFRTTHLINLGDDDLLDILSGPVNVYDSALPHLARVDLLVPRQGALTLRYTFFRLTTAGRQTIVTFDIDLTKRSDFLREVDLEIDRVQGVDPPPTLTVGDNADSPPDLAADIIDVQSAFAEAGIDLNITTGGAVLPTAAGLDRLWTDEELHAAMEANFAQHADVAQWRLYLLLATEYEDSGVLGIMFDDDDSPRQGAAVFADHPALAGSGPARDREYMHTLVHELGHAFNLLHSFQKHIFGDRDQHARPGSPSWMNYPHLFPFGYARPDDWNGTGRFWPDFRFDFDRGELEHLRHFHAMGVVMGGDSFGADGHRRFAEFELPRQDDELEFSLWLPDMVEFMEVVEGDVRLKNTSRRTVETTTTLRPESGFVQILVQRPNTTAPQVYGGVARTCHRGTTDGLGRSQAIYAEITPSVDRFGWTIDEPGTYFVQAVYDGPDGRHLASPVRSIKVLPPRPGLEELGSRVFSRSVARYLALHGSRTASLSGAAEVLQEVSERAPETAIARQASIVEAVRDSRPYKASVVAGSTYSDDDRIAGATRVLERLAPDGAVAAAPSQSHVRLGHQLDVAAQALALSGDSSRALEVKASFLRQIDAPKSAFDLHEQRAEELSVDD